MHETLNNCFGSARRNTIKTNKHGLPECSSAAPVMFSEIKHENPFHIVTESLLKYLEMMDKKKSFFKKKLFLNPIFSLH